MCACVCVCVCVCVKREWKRGIVRVGETGRDWERVGVGSWKVFIVLVPGMPSLSHSFQAFATLGESGRECGREREREER